MGTRDAYRRARPQPAVHRSEDIVLDNGEVIKTDMVVVGAGVRPVTQFLQGVELDHAGGVIVDAYLRAADGIYAAGDIVSFPEPRTGQRVRIEHWHGAAAGANCGTQHGRT